MLRYFIIFSINNYKNYKLLNKLLYKKIYIYFKKFLVKLDTFKLLSIIILNLIIFKLNLNEP